MNYITLGYDCSPAAVLRNLNKRAFALPFDWVVSSVENLEKCFQTDFKYFHTNLKFTASKKRLVDEYGFEFPHDYPLNDHSVQVGDGTIGEEDGKCICDNWADYYEVVKLKYNRRIERFKNIMTSTGPIIVLSRYTTNDLIKLKGVLVTYYNRDNIYFINSTNEPTPIDVDSILNINTEQNGIWNEAVIWDQAIDVVTAALDVS